jgi:hypothetical protein
MRGRVEKPLGCFWRQTLIKKKRKPKNISELSKKNARKAQVLEYFARRDWTLPKTAVTTLGLTGSGWFYLKRMYQRKYLRRGYDVHGALVYKLAPKGSAWLLRQRDLKRKAAREAKNNQE